MEGVSFVCLRFEGADPGGLDRSAADCAKIAGEVAGALDLPLVIAGCKKVEKDAAVFSACAEPARVKLCCFSPCGRKNYKTVGASVALAYGQKVGAESSVDINLAKQLNVLMTQLGVPAGSIVMKRRLGRGWLRL
jgi:acetyl-CoA decarbonylase/synthase complex subunit delta